jgi:hypothetical protein
MTYYLRRTLRFLSKHHAVSAKAQGHFTALLGKGNTKATSSSHSNMVTKNFFIESCGLTEVMQGVVKDLKEYCAGSPIYSYAPKRADGDTLSLCVLPSHSDINASPALSCSCRRPMHNRCGRSSRTNCALVRLKMIRRNHWPSAICLWRSNL